MNKSMAQVRCRGAVPHTPRRGDRGCVAQVIHAAPPCSMQVRRAPALGARAVAPLVPRLSRVRSGGRNRRMLRARCRPRVDAVRPRLRRAAPPCPAAAPAAPTATGAAQCRHGALHQQRQPGGPGDGGGMPLLGAAHLLCGFAPCSCSVHGMTSQPLNAARISIALHADDCTACVTAWRQPLGGGQAGWAFSPPPPPPPPPPHPRACGGSCGHPHPPASQSQGRLPCPTCVLAACVLAAGQQPALGGGGALGMRRQGGGRRGQGAGGVAHACSTHTPARVAPHVGVLACAVGEHARQAWQPHAVSRGRSVGCEGASPSPWSLRLAVTGVSRGGGRLARMGQLATRGPRLLATLSAAPGAAAWMGSGCCTLGWGPARGAAAGALGAAGGRRVDAAGARRTLGATSLRVKRAVGSMVSRRQVPCCAAASSLCAVRRRRRTRPRPGPGLWRLPRRRALRACPGPAPRQP